MAAAAGVFAAFRPPGLRDRKGHARPAGCALCVWGGFVSGFPLALVGCPPGGGVGAFGGEGGCAAVVIYQAGHTGPSTAWQCRAFQRIPRRFTPHYHQTQPHGALTKAPGRAGTAGQTWGVFCCLWIVKTGRPQREKRCGYLGSSHSPLWASHHAGNAGSFGERVGVICLLILVVSFRSLLNGMLMGNSDVAPKYNNFRICACSRVQLFPKYVL